MASICHELSIDVGADQAWSALRQVGEAHTLFAPVLVDCHRDEDTRTVTFANGMVVQERIIDVDDERRRLAYSALDVAGLMYHHASMQVLDKGPGRSLFVWTTDFLPQEMGSRLAPLIAQGARALKDNLETR